MDEMRRTLARSHNRRVMALAIGLGALLYLGVKVFPSRQLMLAWFLVVGVMEVAAIVYVMRLSKRQSVSIGFVCPLCGGPLYDGRDNRIGFRGECPCCKRFIMDKLGEHS